MNKGPVRYTSTHAHALEAGVSAQVEHWECAVQLQLISLRTEIHLLPLGKQSLTLHQEINVSMTTT